MRETVLVVAFPFPVCGPFLLRFFLIFSSLQGLLALPLSSMSLSFSRWIITRSLQRSTNISYFLMILSFSRSFSSSSLILFSLLSLTLSNSSRALASSRRRSALMRSSALGGGLL
ncbi:hypothetical protein F5883DRAFT_150858 [Diaporthe sp. PMI_573]|nr:hypothetical protein F5883DRAFT_150858 [Diaporthaceae sp. PMI_573]